MTPTPKEVRKYIARYRSDPKAITPKRAVQSLFQQYPSNKDFTHVLIKASSLNTLFLTNIYNIYSVADNIHRSNIDPDLTRGDYGVVRRIASGHKLMTSNQRERYFYSFASKYAHFHNPEFYSIYDRFVVRVLMYYKRHFRFAKFTSADLKDFPTFQGIIHQFIRYFQLDEFSLDEIDEYLVLYGQEL